MPMLIGVQPRATMPFCLRTGKYTIGFCSQITHEVVVVTADSLVVALGAPNTKDGNGAAGKTAVDMS